MEIRLIKESDAHEALGIYEHYVHHTSITFEYESPTVEEYLQRIKTNTAKYPWLVAVHDGNIIGFAYGSTHRYRTAYQWSPESTIYLAPGFHTKGIGRALYNTLFSLLRLQGYVNVFAGVVVPNSKSEGFHRALGFEEIGVFKQIGYKHGSWHNTHWFQLSLTDHGPEPKPPLTLDAVKETEQFELILNMANRQLESKMI